ncbi:polyprenyl synthetase family protein [Bacillaceae bacterium SIJ1]|uniref:polyprenyl synthetase family protein n=1 Tax=Litoribacterium kuwaitense TaxID=1398745 RepID=UPI0013EB8399|nr:farnesyl diphosphate synthase [Litoribacterium kuwaitense]NGP43611.1 polyprenyl synthetase family protein [Litoribacterium kuwaitense]
MPSSLDTYLKEMKTVVDQALDQRMAFQAPPSLKSSMEYSLKAGGKRLRPILMIATAEALGGKREDCLAIACALEMIHTYSLIHDDLPAMDDDDYRRGQPTNHKVYGESMAILAGDALLTYAFQMISSSRSYLSADNVVLLIEELAKAAGPSGMVGGQVMDMEAEEVSVPLDQLENIHKNKTGALLSFAVKAGAIVANATEEVQDRLAAFSAHIGLAFQIKDDILDVEGDTALIGKPIGSDMTNAKSTFPSLLTIQGAKDRLNFERTEAMKLLAQLPLNHNEQLTALTQYIVERNY